MEDEEEIDRSPMARMKPPAIDEKQVAGRRASACDRAGQAEPICAHARLILLLASLLMWRCWR